MTKYSVEYTRPLPKSSHKDIQQLCIQRGCMRPQIIKCMCILDGYMGPITQSNEYPCLAIKVF